MPWFGRREANPTDPTSATTVRRCPNADSCALFGRFRTSPPLRVWQRFFCESGFERCARFGRMRCGESVSPTLLPDGTDLAGEP